MKQFRFLLVDDDYDDRELFAGMLQETIPGVEVHTVKDGIEAIKFLQARDLQNLPEAMVMDLNMPQMDGFALLDWLQANPQFGKLAKFVLSTSAHPRHRQSCLDKGADGYFVKPNNIHEITAIAEKMVAYLSAGKDTINPYR